MKNNIDKKYFLLKKNLIIKLIENKIKTKKRERFLSLNQFVCLVTMCTDLSVRKSRWTINEDNRFIRANLSTCVKTDFSSKWIQLTITIKIK